MMAFRPNRAQNHAHALAALYGKRRALAVVVMNQLITQQQLQTFECATVSACTSNTLLSSAARVPQGRQARLTSVPQSCRPARKAQSRAACAQRGRAQVSTANEAPSARVRPTFFCPISTAVRTRKSSFVRYRSALVSSFMFEYARREWRPPALGHDVDEKYMFRTIIAKIHTINPAQSQMGWESKTMQ
jgi:hypothetical protein